MEQFRRLGICEPILKSIQEEKFVEPSEIQEMAIPLTLEGKDIIAGSATGSGKTLAFGAAIIQKNEKNKGLQSLILVPTRELAEQVAKALKKFSRYKPLEILPVYGGVSINPQIDRLRYANIVVGTPGRILDHLERRTINLSKLSILVLDEADRMLDMGFIVDVKKIISQCPTERQTMLFSATIEGEVADIARRYMNDPVKVSTECYVDPQKLHQVYFDVPDNQKFSLLVHLLKNEISGLVMVFCNTQRTTDFVAKNLSKSGIEALAIHGGFSQVRRNKIMDEFHSNTAHVLVCTDVAARGLDIKSVSHVYNYDTPPDEKQYVHRIGRTARAGEEGKVVNLVSSRDHDNFNRVLRYNHLTVPREPLPEFEKVRVDIASSPRREGQFGNRSHSGPRSFHSHGPSSSPGSFGKKRFGPRRSFGGSNAGQRSYSEGSENRGFQGNRGRSVQGENNSSSQSYAGRPRRKSYGVSRFGNQR